METFEQGECLCVDLKCITLFPAEAFRFRKFKSLSFKMTPKTMEYIDQLSNVIDLSELKTLKVEACNDVVNMDIFSGFPNVENLSSVGIDISPYFPNLKSLYIHSIKERTINIGENLLDLTIINFDITDETMNKISKNKTIKRLDLHDAQWDFKRFSLPSQLETFEFFYRKFDNEDLKKVISECPNINNLLLLETQVTRFDLVTKFKKLKTLVLDVVYNETNYDLFNEINTQLTSLTIPIRTEESFKRVTTSFVNLEYFDTGFENEDRKIGDRCLKYLENLKHLKSVRFDAMIFSYQSFLNFLTKYPNIKIESDLQSTLQSAFQKIPKRFITFTNEPGFFEFVIASMDDKCLSAVEEVAFEEGCKDTKNKIATLKKIMRNLRHITTH